MLRGSRTTTGTPTSVNTPSTVARLDSPPREPLTIREEVRGDYQWCIASTHYDAINSSDLDWFNLTEGPNCTLVKRNSQRDVWRVRCRGRDYFAKLYHPNGWVAKAKLLVRGPIALCEWEVGRYGSAHGIATVIPVATAWTGTRGSGGPSLLITEAVNDGIPLNDFWVAIRDDRAKARLLTDSLARLIARSHQCGFQHGDMHPGNILVREQSPRCEALFVDLHKVHIAATVSQRQAVKNLAQLNQWFRSHASRAQRRRFLVDYAVYRREYALASPFAQDLHLEPGRLIAELQAQAERHAAALWSKRDRRVVKNSRYFARIKPASGWRGHVLLSCKHPSAAASASKLDYTKKQWKEWLAEPLSLVDPAKHKMLKDSHTATVCEITLPTNPPVKVIAKRPLARNAWKKLTQLFGPSRNQRAWRIANMLRNRDIATAQPMAIIERRLFGGVLLDSLLLTEFIDGAVDLETFLTRDLAALPGGRQRVVKDRLIAAVVRTVKTFHDRGFVHRDLKAPNLLVTWAPPYESEPLLTFIDMDGISFARRPGESQRLRAVVRLCASLLHSAACTRTDKLRFLKSYLAGPGRTTAAWKTDWRAIHQLVCDKLADKDLRRQWKIAHYGRA